MGRCSNSRRPASIRWGAVLLPGAGGAVAGLGMLPGRGHCSPLLPRRIESSWKEARMVMRKAMFARPGWLLAATTVMFAAGMTAAAAQSSPSAAPEWPMAGQNISDTHFQAAGPAISAGNVHTLAPKWTLTTAGAVSATPTLVRG